MSFSLLSYFSFISFPSQVAQTHSNRTSLSFHPFFLFLQLSSHVINVLSYYAPTTKKLQTLKLIWWNVLSKSEVDEILSSVRLFSRYLFNRVVLLENWQERKIPYIRNESPGVCRRKWESGEANVTAVVRHPRLGSIFPSESPIEFLIILLISVRVEVRPKRAYKEDVSSFFFFFFPHSKPTTTSHQTQTPHYKMSSDDSHFVGWIGEDKNCVGNMEWKVSKRVIILSSRSIFSLSFFSSFEVNCESIFEKIDWTESRRETQSSQPSKLITT